jgi:uncharacterized membrane protein
MNNLNWKLIIAALLLFISAIAAYYNWDFMKLLIAGFLKSPLLTLGIWALIVIVSIIHYINNHSQELNSINDKEGLERPLDYLQFIGTYATILTSAQTFGREFFFQWNFPNETNCKNFSEFDKICMISCVFVLIYYSFLKIKPVVGEAFKKRATIHAGQQSEISQNTNR